MKSKLLLIALICATPRISLAFDIGISSSGKDISIDLWTSEVEGSNWGAYMRGIYDFEDYTNGAQVTVCRDGSISGSTGSGTCSGHGGVGHAKDAEFSRIAITAGPTYWVHKTIQLHAGLIYGMYSSDINVGEKDKLDFSETGAEFGISLKPFDSSLKLVLNHETEQKRTSIGIRFSL